MARGEVLPKNRPERPLRRLPRRNTWIRNCAATGCTISESPKPHQAFDQLAQVVRHDRFFQIGPLGGVEKLFDLGAQGIAGDERQAGDLVPPRRAAAAERRCRLTRGSRIAKAAPSPGALSTTILPPCSETIRQPAFGQPRRPLSAYILGGRIQEFVRAWIRHHTLGWKTHGNGSADADFAL